MIVGFPETRIGKLTVSGRGRDASGLGLRAERAFATADLLPRTLHKSAILFVRHLRTELSVDWESAARSTLDDIARRAVRPAACSVSSASDAVVFSDFAELLSCLASDYCDGSLGTRWWWSRLLKGSDILEEVLRAWYDHPQYIPAAVEQLVQRRISVKFFTAIPDRIAIALTTALRPAFGVQTSVVEETDLGEETIGVWREELLRDTESVRRIVPESFTPQLSCDQQVLLGTALLIHRSLPLAQSAAYPKFLRKWQELGSSGMAVIEAVAAQRQIDDEVDEPRRFIAGKAKPAQSKVSIRATQEDERGQSVFLGGEIQSTPISAATVTVADRRTGSIPAPSLASASIPSGELGASHPSLSPLAIREEDPASEELTILATAYAGVFYLINVALELGLYNDFLSANDPGISLPIWDFLFLVSRGIAEPEPDVLWQLLARLANRNAGEELGISFDCPDHWRLAPEWLAPFPERCNWKLIRVGNRSQLIHPRGFCVLDRAGDCDVHATSAVHGIDLASLQIGTQPAEDLRSPQDRWTAHLVQYLRVRLGPLAGTICRRSGRIELTSTNLDVIFALHQIDIDIRVSGFDRDPGWVPSAGRFIRFHYE